MEFIQGSVMDFDNYEKLQRAKHYLEVQKSYKLEARHQKNIRKDWPQAAVLNHIKEEVAELEEGFKAGDKVNIIEELADVINCCEILAMMVIY